VLLGISAMLPKNANIFWLRDKKIALRWGAVLTIETLTDRSKIQEVNR